MTTIFPSMLFYTAAALMLLDAILYSVGALGGIQVELAPSNVYWSKRLLLNLLLANAGLYFTALFTFIGAYLASVARNTASPVLIMSGLVCAYSAISVPILTPKDWAHTLPRIGAGILIIIGLFNR